MNKMVLEVLLPVLLLTEYSYGTTDTHVLLVCLVGSAFYLAFLAGIAGEYGAMMYGITSGLIIFGITAVDASGDWYSVVLYWVVTGLLVLYGSQHDWRLPTRFFVLRYGVGAVVMVVWSIACMQHDLVYVRMFTLLGALLPIAVFFLEKTTGSIERLP
jgi:hypothetical protein